MPGRRAERGTRGDTRQLDSSGCTERKAACLARVGVQQSFQVGWRRIEVERRCKRADCALPEAPAQVQRRTCGVPIAPALAPCSFSRVVRCCSCLRQVGSGRPALLRCPMLENGTLILLAPSYIPTAPSTHEQGLVPLRALLHRLICLSSSPTQAVHPVHPCRRVLSIGALAAS